jgi:hypothetical protein
MRSAAPGLSHIPLRQHHGRVSRKIVAARPAGSPAPSAMNAASMVEREETIDSRRNRQRRDQALITAGYSVIDRRRHHERRSDRHRSASVRERVVGDIICRPCERRTHTPRGLSSREKATLTSLPIDAQADGSRSADTATKSAASTTETSGRS